jgi:hypothetical protein
MEGSFETILFLIAELIKELSATRRINRDRIRGAAGGAN